MTPTLLSMLSESRALVFLLGVICGGTIVGLMAILAATFGRALTRSDDAIVRDIVGAPRRPDPTPSATVGRMESEVIARARRA